MIDLPLYFGFLVASVILIAIPGPNVFMIATQSMQCGRRAGLTIVLGLTVGQALQIMMVLLGLTTVLHLWATAYTVMKTVGAAYLLWLAVKAFARALGSHGSVRYEKARSDTHLFRRGMLVALANPKTMLFHAAFLPQFVSEGDPVTAQLIILAISFLLVALSLDSLWALGFGSARRMVAHPRMQTGLNWLSGIIYLVMGGFVLSRRVAG